MREINGFYNSESPDKKPLSSSERKLLDQSIKL